VAKGTGFETATWTKEDDHEWKKTKNLEMKKLYGIGHLIFVDDAKLHEKFVVQYLDNAM
jgi:hypothetical protein